jgi:hypothetical protein
MLDSPLAVHLQLVRLPVEGLFICASEYDAWCAGLIPGMVCNQRKALAVSCQRWRGSVVDKTRDRNGTVFYD